MFGKSAGVRYFANIMSVYKVQVIKSAKHHKLKNYAELCKVQNCANYKILQNKNANFKNV